KARPNTQPMSSPAHAPQRANANHNTTTEAIARGHTFQLGNAKVISSPDAAARPRFLSNRIAKAYCPPPVLVGNDASAHGSDRLVGGLAHVGRGGGVGNLVEGVDHLLAPAHHVARSDLRSRE